MSQAKKLTEGERDVAAQTSARDARCGRAELRAALLWREHEYLREQYEALSGRLAQTFEDLEQARARRQAVARPGPEAITGAPAPKPLVAPVGGQPSGTMDPASKVVDLCEYRWRRKSDG